MPMITSYWQNLTAYRYIVGNERANDDFLKGVASTLPTTELKLES